MGLFSCFRGGRSNSSTRNKRQRRQKSEKPPRRTRSSRRSARIASRSRSSGLGQSPSGGDFTPTYASPRSVFSDEDYFDAVDQHSAASGGSSIGSHDQYHHTSSTNVSPTNANHESVLDRISHWWHSMREEYSDHEDNDQYEYDKNNGYGNDADQMSDATYTRVSSSSSQQQQQHSRPPKMVLPPGALILSQEEVTLPGCMPLFSPNQTAISTKKFITIKKPLAGSSFQHFNRQSNTDPCPPDGTTTLHTTTINTTPLNTGSTSSSTHPLSNTTTTPPLPLPTSTSTSSSMPAMKTSKSSPEHRYLSVDGEVVPPLPTYAYEQPDATRFYIRSKNYMQTKVKERSAHSIYQLIGVDMYSFDFKLYHIAQHIQLPSTPVLGPEAQALPQGKKFPPLLIVNLQLPSYSPSVFGGNDGPGHSLVNYFALPEGWQPSDIKNTAALGLIQRFANNGFESDGQPTRDRLKILARIINVDEWSDVGPLSAAEQRLLKNYNGKPILTRPQQRYYSSPDGSYLEVDIDVHSWAYIARRAYSGYLTRLSRVVFENALVVQGNRAEELPEVVMAASRVYRVDFTKARPFPAQSLEDGDGLIPDGPARRNTTTNA